MSPRILSKLQHPGWAGVILPLLLAIGATFSPGTVRLFLLGFAILAASWTFYFTELGNRSVGRTLLAGFVYLLVAALIYVAGRKFDAPPQVTVTAPKDPVIEVSYDTLGGTLPITVKPDEPVAIITIGQDRKVSSQTLLSEEQPWRWPKTKGKKLEPQEALPEIIGRLNVVNQGDIGVFDVNIQLVFKIGAERARPFGGTSIQMLPLALKAGGDRYSVYVVNQSEFGGLIEVPTSGLMLVQGEHEPRNIKLRHRVQGDPYDVIWPVFASPFKWAGGVLLNPDF